MGPSSEAKRSGYTPEKIESMIGTFLTGLERRWRSDWSSHPHTGTTQLSTKDLTDAQQRLFSRDPDAAQTAIERAHSLGWAVTITTSWGEVARDYQDSNSGKAVAPHATITPL